MKINIKTQDPLYKNSDSLPSIIYLMDFLSSIDSVNIESGIYDAEESLTSTVLDKIGKEGFLQMVFTYED